MNTGENYNKIVHGSGFSKFKAKVSALKSWLEHPRLKESQIKSRRNKFVNYADFLSAVALHGATLEDFILYEFYNKSNKERKTYVTGKKLHDFFDRVNNKNKTDLFFNKNSFSENFREYLGRDTFELNLDGENIDDAKKWLTRFEVIFAKPSKGAEGKGVTRLVVDDVNETIKYCIDNKLDTLEEPIIQSSSMNELYADAINTVRMITFIKDGEVVFLGATLRIGNGGYVDNAGSGGLFASVNIDSGKLNSFAFDKEGNKIECHPITDIKIKGFQIPYWSEVLALCKEAALKIPDVRTVGWDVALTEDGPILIEGNDRWSRAVWQLPKQKGLYHLIKE